MDTLLFIGFIIFMLTLVAYLRQSEADRDKKDGGELSARSEEKAKFQAGSSTPVCQMASEIGEASITTLAEVGNGDPLEEDYQFWVSILSEKNSHISEFQLYGTKAAIIWGEKGFGNSVQVVCITSFSKGTPATKKYECYQFDIAGWYWGGMQPRGCASEIKKYIKSLGLSGAKEKTTA
jgi:hypothetical protein